MSHISADMHGATRSIPFENLDVLLGRPISLEPEALFQKLVVERRGGYCFEQNLLFKAALEALGYEVEPHLARVREKVCASLSCQAAIKVHRPLGGEEMARLTAELLASSNPYACPHGRPIIVDIKHIDIERHFHRR